MNSDAFLLVTLSLTLSSTGLITERSLVNSWMIFLGGLLGSVFGMMGSVASIMSLFESNYKRLKKKYRDSIRFTEIFEARGRLNYDMEMIMERNVVMVEEDKLKRNNGSISIEKCDKVFPYTCPGEEIL